MKKLITLILALTLIFSLAACKSDDGASSPSDTTGAGDSTPDVPTVPDVTDAPVDILKAAWAKVADDSKFPVGGGDAEHTDFEGPGLVTDTAFMGATLLVPEAEQSKIDAVGSFMHMMNANSFTCGAYHLTNASDADAFAQTMRDTIAGNQWMCGFPETVYIAKVGTSNVVVMFGVNDAVNPVKAGLADAYGESVSVLFDEPIAG